MTKIICILSFLSFTAYAKDPAIKEILIDEKEYVCRPADMAVSCPITDLAFTMAFPYSSSESVECSNAIQGRPETLKEDQQIAKKCFSSARILSVSNQLSRLMVNKNCLARFYAKCSESIECLEPDKVFGGIRTRCGFLGQYLDFLVRVKGLSSEIFSEEEGKKWCRELF